MSLLVGEDQLAVYDLPVALLHTKNLFDKSVTKSFSISLYLSFTIIN